MTMLILRTLKISPFEMFINFSTFTLKCIFVNFFIHLRFTGAENFFAGKNLYIWRFRKPKIAFVSLITDSRDQAKAVHSRKSTQLFVYGSVCVLADRRWGVGRDFGCVWQWSQFFCVHNQRYQRVGWPLLSVETVVNGGSGWILGVCGSGASMYTNRDTREGWPLACWRLKLR